MSGVSEINEDPQKKLARLLMTVTATVYEGYQADQFSSVGGLFPRLEGDLIDAEFYSRMGEVIKGVPGLREPVIPANAFNALKIPPAKIVEFRKTSHFERYMKLLREFKQPKPGLSLLEVNPDFYSYLSNTYAPAVARMFPEAISSGSIKNVATLVECAAWPLFAIETLFEGLFVLGSPLLITVAKIARDNSDFLSQKGNDARNANLVRSFRRRLNKFIAKRIS